MASRIDYNDPHGKGELGLPYHYEMVSDIKRVTPFKAAITANSKDKIVIESGPGTGIMSITAAKAGAKSVTAFEIDPIVAEFTKGNFIKSGASNLSLLQKSTFEVTPEEFGGEKADVVIAENLSTWFTTEPQIQIMNHINQKLAKKDAVRIPSSVDNKIELAYSKYVFDDTVELRTQFFQFTGIISPKILSEPTLFKRVDLSTINPEFFDDYCEVVANQDGIINSLRLTSPVEVSKDIYFDQSDSLMPPVVIPLDEDYTVKLGEKLKVHIKYQTNTSWKQFKATISRADTCPQ